MSRRGNDKNQQILKALLKEPGNSHCADCKTASHPRWASWNLGIFICIRCSGIHRSMGTHISRVKSVDLDTWTDEQVTSMVKWGNNKANTFWEAKLPGGSHTPDGSKVENFVRTKYDMKKWAASSQVPDPSTLSNGVSTSTSNSNSTTSINTNSTTTTQDNRRSLNSSLLDLEFGSPIAAPPQSSRPFNSSTQSLPQSIRASPQANVIPSAELLQQPQQHQQQQYHHQQQSKDNSRPELKKSILSLYSTPMASTSTPNFNSRPTTQQVNNSNNSLAGLNFGNNNSSFSSVQPPAPQQQQYQQAPAPQISSQSNWGINSGSNVWASTSSTTTANNGSSALNKSNGLDDDLFKNVWN